MGNDTPAGSPVDSVEADIEAILTCWQQHMKMDEHYVLLHDFDADAAPHQYPQVAEAASKFFGKRFSWRGGWSAVWRIKGNGAV